MNHGNEQSVIVPIGSRRGESMNLSVAQAVPYPRVIWLTRGAGRVMVDDRMLGFAANTIVIFPGRSGAYLDLQTSAIGWSVNLVEQQRFALPSSTFISAIASLEAQGRITAAMSDIAREYSGWNLGTGLAVEARLELLMVEIARALKASPDGCRANREYRTRLLDDIEAIDALASERVKALNIAAKA